MKCRNKQFSPENTQEVFQCCSKLVQQSFDISVPNIQGFNCVCALYLVYIKGNLVDLNDY